MERHAVGRFRKAGGAAIEPNDIGIGRPRAVGQDIVKVGAVKLRIGRAVQSLMLVRQREALDLLAGVVQTEHVGAGPHADLGDGLLKAEMTQRVHPVGADLDTGADFFELRSLFVDLDVVALLHQEGCSRQAAETGAGDEDFMSSHRVVYSQCLVRGRVGALFRLCRSADQALISAGRAGR